MKILENEKKDREIICYKFALLAQANYQGQLFISVDDNLQGSYLHSRLSLYLVCLWSFVNVTLFGNAGFVFFTNMLLVLSQNVLQ